MLYDLGRVHPRVSLGMARALARLACNAKCLQFGRTNYLDCSNVVKVVALDTDSKPLGEVPRLSRSDRAVVLSATFLPALRGHRAHRIVAGESFIPVRNEDVA